jgi:hypothetical protein
MMVAVGSVMRQALEQVSRRERATRPSGAGDRALQNDMLAQYG